MAIFSVKLYADADMKRYTCHHIMKCNLNESKSASKSEFKTDFETESNSKFETNLRRRRMV